MAKYYQKYAQGRKKVGNPDLYAELRAFGRQNQDIVNAAKEHDLRIQQRNDAWDKSQKGVESNALENRRELQEFENQKFNTRKDAIQKRRDTEVDRLKGEAKIAERRASDWQALTPVLAKSITDVATTGYQLADLHYGTKEWNKKDADGTTDLVYTTQIVSLAKGNIETKNKATQLKLDAYKKGDKNQFDFVSEKERLNWARAQKLAGNHFRKNYNEIINFFERNIDQSGFKVTKDNVDEIYGLRAEELIRQYGFDPSSVEAIEIRRALKNRGHQQKFKIVTQSDTEKRAEKFRLNKEHFLGSAEGDVGEAILNSWITDQLEIDWRFNPKTNEYELKPIDERLKLRAATQTVGKALAVEDRYQNIGGRKGLQLFRQEFYERRLPAKEGEKAEYNYQKFPEDWEIYEKAYLDEQKKRQANRKGIIESNGEALIVQVERLTNPDIPLLEGEERINPLDTSKGGGFEKLEEMYKLAPTPEAQSFIGSKMDYTVSKSNGYSLTLHKAMLKASASSDAAGWIKIYNQIEDKSIKKAWENKYQLATVFLEAGENFESIEEFSEKQVLRRVGGAPTIPGTNKLKQNYEDQKAELNQYTHWYVENNIGRLKEEFGGDATAFFRKMKDEVSDEFQDKNSKRFPIVHAGGTFSLPGQKTILFANHIHGSSDGQEVQTIDDWTQKMSPWNEFDVYIHPSWNESKKMRLPNISDLIANDDILTDDEAVKIVRGIEEGGGVGNYITIKGDIKELADIHPEWTTRDIVNKVLEKKGFKHRLPPDNETLLRWSGYDSKKPRRIDVNNIRLYRNIMNETKGDFFNYTIEDKLNRNKTYIPGVGSTGLIL